MKRKIMLFCLTGLLSVMSVSANVNVERIGVLLTFNAEGLGVENPVMGGKERPRMPQRPLVIGLEGHTLFFDNTGFDFILQIINGEGEIAYTTSVDSETDEIILPDSLNGAFELRVVVDNGYFWGDITL